ncbi:hypothetical protein B5V89_06520 [Heyndrickxia sporothermodurans]|uniref:hypothetical protein n=1 Tax=Heyndrickxia sporothermodurans TaxID=46224 RepID=UPI000D3437A8|nr:hypothetical protein [Heyndrickxia sporothermodurans]PTY79271.1 hypothetical protein B5V89_06520 [Heyndrickxia sporothermodurans]
MDRWGRFFCFLEAREPSLCCPKRSRKYRVDRTIDQPFYEDFDAFVEAMGDLTPSNYTTKNRIGATEVKVAYAGYGQQQTFEVPKTEVSIEDIS